MVALPVATTRRLWLLSRGRRPISLDITPVIPVGRQLIQSYGGGRFRIAGKTHEGSVLVFAYETRPWPVNEVGEITLQSLAPVTAVDVSCEIILIGSGKASGPPPRELREGLKTAGLILEWMNTGAACRTFNVLLAEERSAVAALIAVD